MRTDGSHADGGAGPAARRKMQTPLNLASVASALFLASHLPSSAPPPLTEDIKISSASGVRPHLTLAEQQDGVRISFFAVEAGHAALALDEGRC